MNYEALFSSVPKKKLEVAVIGVGGFNHSLFVYGSRSHLLSIRVLCDRNINTCVAAYNSIGVPAESIVHGTSARQARSAFESGHFLAFDDVELAMKMPFDIAVEGTGNPEASAVHVLAAIENGKHVVMVTKESDSVVGPLLASKARSNGLIYSLAEGDQPALLVGLVSWARTAGLSVLSAGKASEYDFVYNPINSTMRVMDVTLSVEGFESAWDLVGDPEAAVRARSQLLSIFPQRALPDLSEMGIVSNHLPDFDPDTPSFHFPVARTLEIPDIMCPQEMGGIFSGRSRIDVVNCLRRVDEQSMEGGVYVVVECDDEETWRVLLEKGVPTSRNRKTALVYYPAHYLGFEALFSVLSAGLLGLPSGSSEPKPRYDLVARATKTIKAGTILRAEGHHHTIDGFEGLLFPAKAIDGNTQLPYYLADRTRVRNDIAPGSFLTADALEVDEAAILWKLRREQDRVFFGASG